MQEFRVPNSSPSLDGVWNFFLQENLAVLEMLGFGAQEERGAGIFLFLWGFYLFWHFGSRNANSHPAVPVEKGILGISGAWGW